MPPRPSLLPKLAQCPRYEPAPGCTDAMVRGLNLDRAFRTQLGISPGDGDGSGTSSTWTVDAGSPDHAALQWAVTAARTLAGGATIETRESHLRVRALGLRGTADALCTARGWSADLKAGEIRDYEAQQAAYALGFMDRTQTDRWTVHLLYCDAREVVTLDFTRGSAEQLLRGILARVQDPHARATPCDYCDWCALRWTCAARLEPLSLLLFGTPEQLDVQALEQDPAHLGAVLAITHEIAREDGLHDQLKRAARTHLEAEHHVPGWTLVKGREPQSVDPATVARHAGELGIGRITAAYGGMSGRKFTQLWTTAHPDTPVPAGAIQTHPAATHLARRRTHAHD